MIKYGMWAFAVVATVVWSNPGRPADDDELIAESGAMEIVLLRQHAVQKELKLTDAHGKKIHEFASGQWKKAREIHKLPEKEQDAKYEELTKENEKFLADLLSPEQRKRLDQIALQVAGLLQVGRPDVASALGLTAEQKKKVEELHKAAHKEARAIMKTATNDDAKSEQLKALRDLDKKQLLDLLTAEQKEKWKTLIGAEFTGELEFHKPKKDKD